MEILLQVVQSLNVSDKFMNYSTVNLNGGDVTLKGSIDNFVGGNIIYCGCNSLYTWPRCKVNKGSVNISSGSLLLKKADGSEVDKKLRN